MQHVSWVCGPTCRNWRKAITSAFRELTLSEQCDEDVILLRRWGNLYRYSEGSQCLSLQSQSTRVDLLFLEMLDAKLLDTKLKDVSGTSEFIYLRAHNNIPEDMNLQWHAVFYLGMHLFQLVCIRNVVSFKTVQTFSSLDSNTIFGHNHHLFSTNLFHCATSYGVQNQRYIQDNKFKQTITYLSAYILNHPLIFLMNTFSSVSILTDLNMAS
jgi:hypothetical protein